MMQAWEVWLLLVGLAVGAAAVFVLMVRLPRDDEDVDESERRAEAGWIADTIERHGGVAPPSFVEEVLDLHATYLQVRRPPTPRTGPTSAPPTGTIPPGYTPPPPPPARQR